jgi:hypothetical protein
LHFYQFLRIILVTKQIASVRFNGQSAWYDIIKRTSVLYGGEKAMTREEARKLLKQLDRDDLRKIKAMAEMLNARRKAAEKEERKAV